MPGPRLIHLIRCLLILVLAARAMHGGEVDPGDSPGSLIIPLPEGYELEFAWIEAGSFHRGSPTDEVGRRNHESPMHRVIISRGFHLARVEVTWMQWSIVRRWAVMNGYELSIGRMGSQGDSSNDGDHPVTMITWFDALKWCNALSEMLGLEPAYRAGDEVFRMGESVVTWDREANGFRLPSEAEWEYAARADSSSAFYTGSILHPQSFPPDPNLDRAGWYAGNSRGTTRPIGLKDPNAWGLYDMHGNVWEWCWDWRGPYPDQAVTDPMGTESGTYRIVRGGGWNNTAQDCRAARRGGTVPNFRSQRAGFRPAVGMPPRPRL